MVIISEPLKILDVGCGTGQNYHEFLQHGEYYGIDISLENIKSNTINFPRAHFSVADITKHTNFPNNYFDKIFCYDVLEHVNNLDNSLTEIYRIINKTTGKLIVEVPSYFSESIFIKLNPKYNDQVSHKRNLTEKEWIEKIQKHGFFLRRKKYKKFNDFLYLTYKFFRGKNIINEMGEFDEGILSKEDKLNSEIWSLNNQLINSLYSPLYGKSLKLEFKTKPCKLIKYKNNIQIIEKITFENQSLKYKNQKIKSELIQIQKSKIYKTYQQYNKIKNLLKKCFTP